MDKKAKIAVVGYGIEGASVVDYLARHGFLDVTVCDADSDLDVPVKSRLGAGYLDSLGDFDVVFRSPGVHLKKLKSAGADAGVNGATADAGVKSAGAAGAVTSAMRLFFEKCPCPIIGVSGTKGKGTCASLIAAILGPGSKNLSRKGSAPSPKVCLGGNIGVPALDFLDDLTASDLAVLELSSFQLQDLDRSPHVAVLLNTTCDHLNYHADVGEYRDAKTALLRYQGPDDFAVLNRDYEYFSYYSKMARGKLMQVSRKVRIDDGTYEVGGKIYFGDEFIMDVSDVGLVGGHNIENVLPAVCVGKIFGAPAAQIAEAVRGFEGLPHRIEFVREINGVRYFNDSCSTNPETSIAAVRSFDEPLILIAGGSDKGASFEQWGRELCGRPNLRTVILIGETADKLEDALMNACGEKLLRILRRGDLFEAVLDAYSIAEPGSTVLLSPGCASFDLFKNYKERGEAFIKAVLSLRPFRT